MHIHRVNLHLANSTIGFGNLQCEMRGAMETVGRNKKGSSHAPLIFSLIIGRSPLNEHRDVCPFMRINIQFRFQCLYQETDRGGISYRDKPKGDIEGKGGEGSLYSSGLVPVM